MAPALATDQVRVALENNSPYYIQAHVTRKKELGSARTQPGIAPSEPGSAFILVRALQGEVPKDDIVSMFPHDLPPGGRLEMDLKVPPTKWSDALTKVVVFPFFTTSTRNSP